MDAETKHVRVSGVRPMIGTDAARVSEILREAPEAVFWPEASVREVLGWHNAVVFVSTHEKTTVARGFVIARQAADEAEILNLAVEQGSRRRGQGSALLQATEDQLRVLGVKRLFLEVRESNAVGIAFYRKQGFRQAGRRAGYYHQPEEAALLMEKQLAE